MEVYCYHNIESLFGIFNALAAMVGAQGYVQSLALVAVIGFVMAFLAYAFAPEKLYGWKWLASVLLVYAVLLVPRVTVQLIDKTGVEPPRVVANVPFGAAVFGSVTSQVGNTLTELFETAFQSVGYPAGLSYQQHGLMFGARMVANTRNVVLVSPAFRTDIISFLDNCTRYDLADGTINPQAFSVTADLWTLMGTNPNPARMTVIASGVATPTIMTCTAAYTALNALVPAQVTDILNRIAVSANPYLPPATARTLVAGQIETAYTYNRLATAATTANQILMQNATINAINDASGIIGQRTNDPSSLLLAMGRAQAVARTNASWMNFGKVAEEALPLIRNSIEALIYALFPLVILLLFLTAGIKTAQALKSYLLTLLWIQMWPPVYAVLNYMASVATSSKLAAAGNTGAIDSAITLLTASPVYSNAISAEAVVGYLVISVPAIAWAAIKGMETIGQAALTGVSSLQGTISQTSGAAALGSPTPMGSISNQQQLLAPQRTSAFMEAWQDANGTTHHQGMLSGIHAQHMLRNQGYGSQTVKYSVTEKDAEAAGRRVEAAQGESVAARSALAAATSDAFLRGRSTIARNESGTGTFSSSFEGKRQAFNEMDQIILNVSKTLGVGYQEASRLAFNLSMNPGLMGFSTGMSGNRTYSAGLTENEQKLSNTLSSEQLQKLNEFGQRLTSDRSFSQGVLGEGRDASDLSVRLTDEHQRVSQADAALRDAVYVSRSLEKEKGVGMVYTYELSADPRHRETFERMHSEYGGSTAAAVVATMNEMARESGNRFVTNWGGMLPTSFDDVRGAYGGYSSDPRMNPDIQAGHQDNLDWVKAVRGVSSAPAIPRPAMNAPGAVGAVEGKRADLDRAGVNAQEAFDSKHKIEIGPDGRPHSGTSESMKVLKGAGSDGQKMVDKLIGDRFKGLREAGDILKPKQ